MSHGIQIREEMRQLLQHASRVDSGLVLWGTFDPARHALRIVAAEIHTRQVFNSRYRATEYLLAAQEWFRMRQRDDIPRFARQLGFRLSQAFCLIPSPGED